MEVTLNFRLSCCDAGRWACSPEV